MKILITGATGYVGINFVNFFYNDGFRNIYTFSRKKINSSKIKYQYIGDINKENLFKSKKEHFDLIINLIANTNHFYDKKKIYKDNVSTLKNLLQYLDGSYNHFIHMSTESVFLSGKLKNLSHKSKLPSFLLSDYAWSKNLAEKFFFGFLNTHGTKVVLRPRLIWGGYRSRVKYKINNALKNGHFFYLDNGDYKTSICHVKNLYLSILKVIKHAKNNDAFFIVDRDPVVFRDFVLKNISKFNVNKKIHNLPRLLIFFGCAFSDLIRKFTFGINMLSLCNEFCS
jgi:nucleoside-diphosphate-sugar epimerase